jgi:hypothetical protein
MGLSYLSGGSVLRILSLSDSFNLHVLMTRNILNQLTAEERWIVTGAIVRTVIVAFVLIIRFVCKLTRKQKDMRLGWDDFWIVFAVALNWTGEVLTAWSTLCILSLHTHSLKTKLTLSFRCGQKSWQHSYSRTEG